ncbi:MAG: imidazole glycerol phosphate synthase subunit HisH [Pseudomonadota bacterium]
MSTEVAIVGSGGANIASLLFALERLGSRATLTTDADTLAGAARVILPGVGAAADAMSRLQQLELVAVLRSLTQPVLGICLGMQLLAQGSDEDDADCLGVASNRCTRIARSAELPVPHMGWNTLNSVTSNPLLRGVERGAHCYFVHSYALPISAETIAECDYGEPFSAAIQRDNFFGTQFHPERSAETGARILQNFLQL